MSKDLIKELAPDNSNEEVNEIIKKDFQDVMWQVLIYLEIAFPHEKGDGSENEKLFNTIRPKILRIGNNKIRDLEKLLQSYAVLKVLEFKPAVKQDIKVDIVNFRDKFKVSNKGADNGKADSKE